MNYDLTNGKVNDRVNDVDEPTKPTLPKFEVDPEDPHFDEHRIPDTQARRIITKFGGARNLSRCLIASGYKRDPTTVFRWAYEKERGGCGGLIPTGAWPGIMAAARKFGIIITPEDLDPRPKWIRPRNTHNTPPVLRTNGILKIDTAPRVKPPRVKRENRRVVDGKENVERLSVRITSKLLKKPTDDDIFY